MTKKIIGVVLSLVMMCCLVGCSEEEPEVDRHTNTSTSTNEGSWAFYWYLCGSDLESNGGYATDDLNELLSVQLPENIQFVIETGGASSWQNAQVDPTCLQRYVFDSEGLQLVGNEDQASMGEESTLESFLDYAKTNYPADHTAVLFWNHGGGSVSGAAFDENYDLDSLNLNEMKEAFHSVFEGSTTNLPLEFVGFDTCLMATIDVADIFTDMAHYLIASEETEPANGWAYDKWVGQLAENPTMSTEELGKIICDAYYEGCEEVGTADQTTLSLTDLSKVNELLQAYDAFGAEALSVAAKDSSFFSKFYRMASSSENYGGNTKEQGYTNMVDLGSLADQSSSTLTTAQKVMDALEQCVVYKVEGAYRSGSTGLSCYYSYNGDQEDFEGYKQIAASKAFENFYAYQLTGELSDGGEQYVTVNPDQPLEVVQTLSTTDWEDKPLDVNDDGEAYLTLGPEANDILANIQFVLYYIDEENDAMMRLGYDDDLVADWDNGVFYDNFRGVWGSIDGNLVYMELSDSSDTYNIYTVPILLNEEKCNLEVAYDFDTEEWSILGARQEIDDSGMADKNLRLLKSGDTITTLWYFASYSGDDDFEPYEANTFTVSSSTSFYETALPDAEYGLMFVMNDATGNEVYSGPAFFTIEDGSISTYVQ